MKHSVLLGASLALLVACGSTNPFMDDGDGGGDGTVSSTNQLPEALRGDVQKITYTPGNGTITVEGITLDGPNPSTVYARNAAFDRPGYQAFVSQDDALDRQTIAFVAQSGNSGAVRAGVVVTGGQFNRVFSGNFVETSGTPNVPPSGLVTYAGNYAGLTNGGPDLTTPGGTPTEVNPNQPSVVTGEVFINADFADNSLNGGIYNRNLETAGGASIIPIPSIVLVSTGIANDGSFEGTVEYSPTQGNAAVVGDFSEVIGSSIGTYGGVFGGPSAEGVGGAVVITEYDGPDDPRGYENELEWGVFVLNQCGTPDANAAICANVNPDAATP